MARHHAAPEMALQETDPQEMEEAVATAEDTETRGDHPCHATEVLLCVNPEAHLQVGLLVVVAWDHLEETRGDQWVALDVTEVLTAMLKATHLDLVVATMTMEEGVTDMEEPQTQWTTGEVLAEINQKVTGLQAA